MLTLPLVIDTDCVSNVVSLQTPSDTIYSPSSLRYWNNDTDTVSRSPITALIGDCCTPLLSLLSLEKKVVACVYLRRCCYTTDVYTNATRHTVPNTLQTTALNICLTQRSWTIRNIHGILQDALGRQSRWQAHNLHCKLYRRHR